MSDSPSKKPTVPWIHIGECPVCGNGLCRVRSGINPQGDSQLYALCDECEAIWIKPDLLGPVRFPDSEDPQCPISGQALYGPYSRWATPEDVKGTEWESEVVIDLPVDITMEPGADQAATGVFVTNEDHASALDVPPLASPAETSPHQTSELHSEDWAYGQDEPRPGC
jgi:hypothetical protein